MFPAVCLCFPSPHFFQVCPSRPWGPLWAWAHPYWLLSRPFHFHFSFHGPSTGFFFLPLLALLATQGAPLGRNWWHRTGNWSSPFPPHRWYFWAHLVCWSLRQNLSSPGQRAGKESESHPNLNCSERGLGTSSTTHPSPSFHIPYGVIIYLPVFSFPHQNLKGKYH